MSLRILPSKIIIIKSCNASASDKALWFFLSLLLLFVLLGRGPPSHGHCPEITYIAQEAITIASILYLKTSFIGSARQMISIGHSSLSGLVSGPLFWGDPRREGGTAVSPLGKPEGMESSFLQWHFCSDSLRSRWLAFHGNAWNPRRAESVSL